MLTSKGRLRNSLWNRLFDLCVYLLIFIVIILALYPLVYIFSNSISASESVLRHSVWLYPVGFNLGNYAKVLQHADIMISYKNSVVYAVLGTAWSLFLTVLGAYPLSKKRLPGRNIFMFLITFTMLFGAGLIPTYLVVKDLGLINKVWALVLPCAVSQYNLIVLRTGFAAISSEMEESAKIDGANDIVILCRIMLPLVKPILMTVCLFYFISKWNDFFHAMIYMNNRSMYPLQLILRELLIESTDSTSMAVMRSGASTVTPFGYKSAIIVVSILPMLIMYPFVQRFFVKGVMIGAVKG